MMRRSLLVGLAALLAAPTAAQAFCGFYVSPGDAPLLADATQVVLMRKGTRTVLSMQNNYKGPPDAFAMVIPVPVVLEEANVKTLPKHVFDKVEGMGAPRLVEYWEQDPCYQERRRDEFKLARPSSSAKPRPVAKSAGADLGVTVEAEFAVGEYQIVILSAKDSTGLDTWLRREKFNIPNGAEPLLRPYVEGGMKFFVAKVDVSKVRFENGRAELSPLRFHYDHGEFVLPVRLGLANSSGTQDLIVNILAPNQRYEVANYMNVTIPTNFDVKVEVKDRFPAFYAALFDRTLEKNPGAVVTEYAWQASTCDPCPGPALGAQDFQLLGADVLDGAGQELASEMPPPPRGRPGGPPLRRLPRRLGFDLVLTRLHARYGKELKDDLVFRAAPAIVGGREHVIDPATHKLEEGAQPARVNNFQGRYAIRYPWTQEITCENPRRGIWGGPPGGGRPSIKPALDLAFAPRGQVQLAAAIVPSDVPEIGLHGGALEVIARPTATENPAGGVATGGGDESRAVAPPPKGARGCGCHASSAGGFGGYALVVIGALAVGRWRRRSTRGA
jgi:MYXO-CTERM domain-containing protein